MKEIWITFRNDLVTSFKDVESVRSDGQTLWVRTGGPLPLAIIPLKWVREISGTNPA